MQSAGVVNASPICHQPGLNLSPKVGGQPLCKMAVVHGMTLCFVNVCSTPELVITPRQETTEPSTPTSQLDIEAGGNFSFPVTPPSEPAAPAAVFGAWPKARRQGHHPHMVRPGFGLIVLQYGPGRQKGLRKTQAVLARMHLSMF